nr:hypothetical protein [Tanacetum cinerariifolium]
GLQQDDMEKRNRSLLLMKEMKVKAHEKSRLHEELLIICEKRRNLVDKLRSIRGIVVVQKAAEFVADTVRKANVQVAQLREVESQMEFRALEKELHVGCAHGSKIREANEESIKMHDYRRLSDELIENIRMRDAYIEEFQRLQMYDSSDEVIESIEILKGMQVDDMEKDSRLILMACEIQNRVYNFKATVTNGTATAEFTFFTESGEKITGHPCSHLMEKFEATDKTQLPIEMVNTIGDCRLDVFDQSCK